MSALQKTSETSGLDLPWAGVQALWGEGHSFPAETKFAAELCSGLRLSKDKDIAVLGSGLCGTARDLAEATDAKISCFEWEPSFETIAQSQNLRSRVGFLLKSHAIAPSGGFQPGRQFDAILSLMRLHERDDRLSLVRQSAAALKANGKLCILDFMSGPETLAAEKRFQLFGMEGLGPMWRPADLKFSMLNMGFSVDVDLDVSAKLRAAIVAGFGQMKDIVLSVMRQQAGGVAVGEALTRDVRRWAARHDALRDGLIEARCFIATRSPPPTKAG